MGVVTGEDRPAPDGAERRISGSETADPPAPAGAGGVRQASLDAPDRGWESVGDVCRIAGASAGLVRRYCDMGLIEFARDRFGRRTFPAGTGRRVAEIKARRVATVMRTRSA